MKQIMRKCALCDKKGEKTVCLESCKFIYDGGKFYHFDCYVQKIMKKEKISEDEAIEKAEDKYFKTMNNDKVLTAIAKDKFFYWIYDYYDVEVINTLFFNKIDKLLNGEYSYRVRAIFTYDDLLAIYQKMATYLNKAYVKNVHKGNNMDIQGRLNYDLEIVISNYDSYIKWKRKQLVQQEEKRLVQEEMIKRSEINSSEVAKVQSANNSKIEDDVVIADLLNEMF